MNVFLGPAFDIAGYAFAPAAVIAPFTGFNVAINTFLAPYSLGEQLTRKRLLSAFIVFLTATLSIGFKKENEDEKWTLEHTKQVLFRWQVLLYAVLFILWLVLNVLIRARTAHGSVLRGFSLGATAGSLAGNMWCTRVAAAFGAECWSTHDCAAWDDWISWAVLAGAILFAAANVPYMAKGMQKYEALFMVTVFQGSNICSNSLSALIVLGEMDGAPWWKIVGYIFCILGMMVGLVCLVASEDACPTSTLEADMKRMISLEALEESNSDSDDPDAMDFLHAVARDPFRTLSRRLSEISSGSLCREDSGDDMV